MKLLLRKDLTLVLFAAFYFAACTKENEPGIISNNPPDPPVVDTTDPTNARPLINANLVPIGTLTIPRGGMSCATAGNKILFAGGYNTNFETRVDIYDFVTQSWSAATLSGEYRSGIGVASVGNKIFIAGGGDAMGDFQTSIIDIYDASNNSWSTSQLSVARQGLVAASAGNKVVFAGGGGFLDGATPWSYSDAVDIYDNATNKWSTAKLSKPRSDLSATVVGDKIYFAGGRIALDVSKTIDILDVTTNTWSTSALQEPKLWMASIAAGNKIYWAGGTKSFAGNNWNNSDLVEIRDINTGNSTFSRIAPRSDFAAVKKGDLIIFFTGSNNGYPNSPDFEIYNTKTDSWQIGRLNQRIFNASIISVNDTIYVAGGQDGQWQFYNKLWRLEF